MQRMAGWSAGYKSAGQSCKNHFSGFQQINTTFTMKCMIVLFALLAVAYAGDFGFAPAVYAHAPVVYARPHIGSTRHHTQDTLGQFDYGFASADGIQRSEGRDAFGNVVGSFGYTSPEGARIETAYTAGPGGFQAVGNAIPQNVLPTPEVVYATNAHLAAKADAFAHTGYGVAPFASPYPYGHHGYHGYY